MAQDGDLEGNDGDNEADAIGDDGQDDENDDDRADNDDADDNT